MFYGTKEVQYLYKTFRETHSIRTKSELNADSIARTKDIQDV